MKIAHRTDEQDHLLADLSTGLAKLIDTAIDAMTPQTQDAIAAAVEAGAQIAILTRMTPWPEFRGLLFTGPDDPAVELFIVSPSTLALRAQPQDEHGH
jgi:hypothetical protein